MRDARKDGEIETNLKTGVIGRKSTNTEKLHEDNDRRETTEELNDSRLILNF